MKISGTIAAAAALAAVLAIPAAAQDETSAVARIGERTITRAEALEAGKEQLEQVEMQYQQCRSEYERNRHEVVEVFTRDLVRRQLVEAEAKATNVTPEALLASIGVTEVTQPEVDAFYEQNRGRIPEGMTRENIDPQIRQFLGEQKRQGALEGFYGVLERKHQVKYIIEPLRTPIAATGPSRGPATAPVTIVEFSDFECPFCERLNPALAQVRKEFGDQVRIVFRQFPLSSIHPNAQKAAEASLCANDQGKFWEMHDALFADRSRLPIAELKKTAATLKMDAKKFDACLDSGKYAEQVKTDLREGMQAGVTGTPALFINGRPLSGAVPFEEIAKIVRDELTRTASR
jgi:protein-disulfide isomerase